MDRLNKKLSKIESINQYTNVIEEKNLDFNTVLNNMPDTMANAVKLLKTQFINISDSCILNCCILKFAQALTIKRPIFIDEKQQSPVIPNWYAIIFMPSGYGKDELSNYLDKFFFKNIRLLFEEQEKNYIEDIKQKIEDEAKKKYPTQKQETTRTKFIQKQFEDIRHLILEATDGTQEGLFSDAKAFFLAGFGSITIKFSEFGAYLKTITTENEKFFNCLYDAFNGTLHSKTTQGRKREKDIYSIPVNALIYSDSTIFKNQLKGILDEFLSKGFARRSMISFQNQTNNLKHKELSKENTKQFLEQAEKIQDDIFKTYNLLENNSCFKFTSDAYYITLQEYSRECINKHNKTLGNINKSEIQSRPFKALKLACIYAILNHPTENVINDTDVIQAILSIEFLSKDLSSFGEYQKEIKTDYDIFFEFFKNNLNQEFSKTELRKKAKEYFRKNSEIIGKRISNEHFNKNFNEYIDFISMSAEEEGFIFNIRTRANNNTLYKMFEKKELKQSNGYKGLEELL